MQPPAINHNKSARRGCWILVAPIVMVGLIVGAYLMVGILGFFGNTATGPRQVLTYNSCIEADDILLARATEMGLGNPVLSHIGNLTSLTVTLPENTEAAAGIPATIAAPGRLSIATDTREDLFNQQNIMSVSLSVGLLGESMVVLELTAEEAASFKTNIDTVKEAIATLDGEPFSLIKVKDLNKKGQLKMIPIASDPRTQINMAARAHVLLNDGQLPCSVTLSGIQQAQ